MILLTGATGFLGKQLLGRLLLLYPQEEIAIIIRANNEQLANTRGKDLLIEIFGSDDYLGFIDRVKIIYGDLTLENFGIATNHYRSLATSTSVVYHCAASTNLNQSLEQARNVNVKSTAQIIRFLKDSVAISDNKAWLHYVSTAYVAGDVNKVVKAEELSLDRNFRNSYERSKAEAELLVRSFNSDKVSTTIYRPSIIVGDSETGQTSAFNVLYVPTKFIIKGLFSALPAVPHAPFDVVPVNYVADAIALLSCLNKKPGKAYHLSAGVGRETSPKEILECIIRAINSFKRGLHFERPPFLAPEIISLISNSITKAVCSIKNLEKLFTKRIDIIRQTLPFIPYMIQNPQFDNSSTNKDLANLLSPPPLFLNYAEKIFHYCLETNWGKTPWPVEMNTNYWRKRINPIFLSQTKLSLINSTTII